MYIPDMPMKSGFSSELGALVEIPLEMHIPRFERRDPGGTWGESSVCRCNSCDCSGKV